MKVKSRSTDGISSWLGSVNDTKGIRGAAEIKLRKIQLTVHQFIQTNHDKNQQRHLQVLLFQDYYREPASNCEEFGLFLKITSISMTADINILQSTL